MAADADSTTEDLFFTEEGRLRHENKFLKDRVANLELFKKNFFEVQHELIETRERMNALEERLNMDRLRDRIVELPDEGAGADQDALGNEGLLEFFHQSITAGSYQDLVMSLFHAVDGLNLDVAVQIRYAKKLLNYADNESRKDALVALINKHRKDGEVVDLGAVLVLNYKYMSLLATGLPVAEERKHQQVMEYLEILAMGTNTRIDTLSKKLELNELRDNIYKIFRKTNKSFEKICEGMDTHVIDISELFQGFEKNLKSSMERMKLSEDHTKLINLLLVDLKAELNLILTSSLTIDEHFMQVMKKLEKAYAPDPHQYPYSGDEKSAGEENSS